MEILNAVGWLLRLWLQFFGPLGLLALLISVLIAVAVVLWAVRMVTSTFGRLFGVRELRLRDWKVAHPSGWRFFTLSAAGAVCTTAALRLARSPSIGIALLAFVAAGGWLLVQAAGFLSGYPLTWRGFVAAAQTAVTKMALNLVWQSIGVVSVQRGKLRLPRYDSWTQAVMVDGWQYGLHCNGFVPPQGNGGLAHIMEMCASPGSEYDTITSNLNNILLDPTELRGPLVTLLRWTRQLPLYAGTTVDRPDGYPQGVGRLTLLQRLPLERRQDYPWRPGYWADHVSDLARRIADDARAELDRAGRLTGRARQQATRAALARRDNALGYAVAEFLAAGVPVGFREDGSLVRVECDDEHTCLMGQTRTGKSTLVECILHVLVEMPADLVRIAVLDLKGGAHLNGYRDRASIFCTNPVEANEALAHLNDTVVRPRYDELRATDRQKIEVPTADTPYWFIAIDEAWRLDDQGMELCANIAREGAAGRVIIAPFSTQYMRSEDGFPRSLDVNLSNRLATRLSDQTAAAKAMTRAGMAANCAPHLIRKSKRTRGVFVCSAGGTDPYYAKSFLTGGIADQKRRTRHAIRRWGAPPRVQFGQPAAAAAAPEAVQELEQRLVAQEQAAEAWTPDREAQFTADLRALAAMCGAGARPPAAGRVTAKQLQTMTNMARRTHNPGRMPAGAERDEVQQRRDRVEELARRLHAAHQARTEHHLTAVTERAAEPTPV